MLLLCTLVKVTGDLQNNLEAIIRVGQHLGVPKDDALELFDEMEEFDVLKLSSFDDKKRFVTDCFSHLDTNQPTKSELRLYNQVLVQLGIQRGAGN